MIFGIFVESDTKIRDRKSGIIYILDKYISYFEKKKNTNYTYTFSTLNISFQKKKRRKHMMRNLKEKYFRSLVSFKFCMQLKRKKNKLNVIYETR